jgi:hypothetical protein
MLGGPFVPVHPEAGVRSALGEKLSAGPAGGSVLVVETGEEETLDGTGCVGERRPEGISLRTQNPGPVGMFNVHARDEVSVGRFGEGPDRVV